MWNHLLGVREPRALFLGINKQVFVLLACGLAHPTADFSQAYRNMYQWALLKFLGFLYMKPVFKGRADTYFRWLSPTHPPSRARLIRKIWRFTVGDHFYRGFALKPSKVEVLDGLNGAADGTLHQGISKYVSARPLNTGFMYKKPKNSYW